MEKISWTAPEYIHSEKTSDWYWIVGIVTISIATIAIILGNTIFAILIIVSSFTLSLFASKKPRVVDIEINKTGITIANNHYPYTNLDSFWIETREIFPKIILKSKKVFMPFIVVLIENVGQEKIHEVLLQYLPEEEHSEPFLEKLLIYFGF